MNALPNFFFRRIFGGQKLGDEFGYWRRIGGRIRAAVVDVGLHCWQSFFGRCFPLSHYSISLYTSLIRPTRLRDAYWQHLVTS